MKKRSFIVCLTSTLLLINSCSETNKEINSIQEVNKTDSLSTLPFPDFGHMLPPDSVDAEVFKLSQNYPNTLPDKSTIPSFFNIDFKTDWKKYMLEVRKYCFEGNTENDFQVQNNKTRDWYHMPWQHYGPSGREGFHGLTKEAPVKPFQLASTQNYPDAVAWAVGFYNNFGGYTIGEVWKDHQNPNPKACKFEVGTVVFKLLYVSIPENIVSKQVPSLSNPILWEAYATKTMGTDDRTKMKVSLIQMDIMIRDDRAPNGWILGTFQYNGLLNNSNKWENLIPVGLMWGEDPTNRVNFSNPTPTETIINTNLKETIINPDTKELPATHLGWNGRLNGPVDNPMSSCFSCHATAEYPQYSPISPLFFPKTHPKVEPGSDEWMRWFENYKCGEPFDKDAVSLDFSLQMSGALSNFYKWRDAQAGLFWNNYNKNSKTPKPRMVHPLRRNI
jgi:hypothetical protein